MARCIASIRALRMSSSSISVSEAEREFEGKGYGEFKLAVGETVADALAPIQAEQRRLLADKERRTMSLRRSIRSGGTASLLEKNIRALIGESAEEAPEPDGPEMGGMNM